MKLTESVVSCGSFNPKLFDSRRGWLHLVDFDKENRSVLFPVRMLLSQTLTPTIKRLVAVDPDGHNGIPWNLPGEVGMF